MTAPNLSPQGSRCPIALLATAVQGLAETRARMDTWDGQFAILDERGRVLEINAAWRAHLTRHGASSGRCEPGADVYEACDKASQSGDDLAPRLARELRGVLEGRTESCEFDGHPTPEGAACTAHIVRLVDPSGTYALLGFERAA